MKPFSNDDKLKDLPRFERVQEFSRTTVQDQEIIRFIIF